MNKIDESHKQYVMRCVDLYATESGNKVANREALEQALEAALKPQYDQQALELCDVCGWKAVIPGDGCLNCRREAALKPGGESEQDKMTAMVDAAMIEMKNIHPPLRRSECQRLIAAALQAAPPAQTPPPRLTEQEINHCIKFPSAGSALKRDGSTSQRIARAIETAVRKQAGWE
jgi:hypothetical protein